jgi:hypothetical protein
LQSDDVACPSAEKSSKYRCAYNREQEENEPGIDDSKLQSLHGLARFHRSSGGSSEVIVGDMDRGQKVNADEYSRT